MYVTLLRNVRHMDLDPPVGIPLECPLVPEMPDPLENYLRQWGLEMYIPTFKEQAIDLDTLQMLSENDIKELVPIIGHRAKLTTQINMLKCITGEGSSEAQTTSQSVINFILDPDDPLFATPVESENALKEATNTQGEQDNAQREPHSTGDSDSSCELYKILSNCNEGKSLLLRFRENGLLNNAARRRLCNIIIGHELKEDPEKKISSSRLYQLAYEIPIIFKKENSSVYFIPFMCYNPKQRTSAKGKLLDCYRQRRREFIKSGVIAESTKRRPSTSSEPGSPRPTFECTSNIQDAIDKLQECNENVNEHLQWLKNCCDPWSTVELYWELTAKIRLNKLTSTETTVQDYLRDFKALNQPGGIFLLVNDFKKLYPLFEDNLHQNWHQLRPKIIDQAIKRQEAGLKEILADINDTEEVLDLVGFMALPFLMTTFNIVKKDKTKLKKQWRPSKYEALQGFICHVKTAAEIEETITRRQNKLHELGLTLQPFIVVVGASLKEISARYVILNNLRFEMTTIIKAVDACFKVIFVLNAEYPAECTHVWQFIQKNLFKLTTKYDKIFTTVRALTTDLGLEM